jgi:hypothetical protein
LGGRAKLCDFSLGLDLIKTVKRERGRNKYILGRNPTEPLICGWRSFTNDPIINLRLSVTFSIAVGIFKG